MNNAKTKIYAWMIHKGVRTLNDIPQDAQAQTMTAYNALYGNKKTNKSTREGR